MSKTKFLVLFVLAVLSLSPVMSLADYHNKQDKKEEKKANQLEHRKDQLKQVIDNMLERLAKLKERVGGRPNIDEGLKTRLFVSIEEWVKKFTDQKARVDALKTIAEVKSFAKETKGLLKKYRELIHEVVDAVRAAQVGRSITKVETRANELDVKVQSLKKDGQDTAEMEKLLTSARNHLDLAKKSLADKKIDEAVNHLKEARNDLNKLAHALKQAKKH